MQPSHIGKYQIISQIGKGGMGSVYKAVHPTLQKTVIIKKLTLTGSKDFIERFRREAQLMMGFTNEKIVQVYDHFKEGNAYHIVMEYVDGITLEELITARRFLPEDVALLIFSEICLALKYAHDRNVIHRDIKPANILISNDGGVKLVDFGVSASLDAGDDDGLTKAGMTIGTPSYLAPEQITNAKNRDKRSDIYSLGVMLYEMIIGKKPFRGGFNPEVIALIEKGKYLPPRKINPKIKPSVQRIIQKAMHHKVTKRYQDLGQVVKKVSRYSKQFKSQAEINKTIKRYLDGMEDPFQSKKGWISRLAGKMILISMGLLIVAGALGLGAAWVIQKGYQYEWLYADRYGALQLTVNVRKGVKDADENYVKVLLFAEENSSLSLREDAMFVFKEVKELENNDYVTLMSQKIYLPSQLYKLVLYVENEQYRENFFLQPRIVQKNVRGTSNARKIQFAIEKDHPSLAVKAEYSVMAMHNGENITAQAEVSVLKGSEWKNWSDFVNGEDSASGFVSGQRYRLRFKHPDYFTKYYNLTILPEQTKVISKISMMPVPGRLHVTTSTPGTKLTINHAEYYLSGDQNRSFKQIQPLSGDPQKIVLSPGDYRLTAKSGKILFGPDPIEEMLTISSHDETHLNIEESPTDSRLHFYFK